MVEREGGRERERNREREREGGGEGERTEIPTNGHALDPVVEVAHVEYTTIGAFFTARLYC